MYSYEYSDELKRKLKKLLKKDKTLYEQILRKMKEVINSGDVEHYKNLKYNMKNSKRIHIGHFVLVFQYIKRKNLIIFDDFEHHDNIYE